MMVRSGIAIVFALALSSGAAAQSFPGFDCSRASIDTEYAICASPVLGLKDRQMNATWAGVTLLSGGQVPRWLDTEQRSWLASRNRCGYDQLCIKQSYEARMRSLEDLDFQD